MHSRYIAVLVMIIRTYTELSRLKSFEERFEYLRLKGSVGKDTFGFDRYLNQAFYRSPEWKSVRGVVILRDNGCDLGLEGYEINDKILIHHLNPISAEDIADRLDDILNPEFLICVSHRTHNAIHYGDFEQLPTLPKERTKNDTCPWRN